MLRHQPLAPRTSTDLGALLQRFESESPNGGDAAGRLRALFVSALRRRLGHDVPAPLYGGQASAAQIRRFELLRARMPFVVTASAIANAFLAEALGDSDAATIVDIGMGDGGQVGQLIDVLAVRGRLPSRLHVIGVEPDGRSLVASQTRLDTLRHQYGIRLTWSPIEAAIVDALPMVVSAIENGPTVVNAAFALHHMNPEASVGRQEVLDAIAELAPAAFTLIEPHASHATGDLAKRIANAWSHYGLVFRAIDRLGFEPEEIAALQTFFAREIDDVVAAPEARRQERHELLSVWAERLRQAGFVLDDDPGALTSIGPGPRIEARHGAVTLTVDDTPVVGVFRASA